MTATAMLWMADADAVTPDDLLRYLGWLAPGEQARHQRFVRARRQRQFVAGRVLLRMALGRLLGVAPHAVSLEERIGQAPRLAAPVPDGAAPGFSIAHSGRWVACAVSPGTALGLDIELLDAGRDLDALARQAFDAGEMARWMAMRGLPVQERAGGFYRLWSEKEARFKLDPELGAGAGHCVAVPHAELSVALCSAVPLAWPPRIEIMALP